MRLLRAVFSSKVTSLFLVFLLIGFGHQLYDYASLRGLDGLLSSPRVNAELAETRRSPSEAPEVVVGLVISDRVCTGVPIRNTAIVMTAAHCLVDERGRLADPSDVTVRPDPEFGLFGEVESLGVHPRYLETAFSRESPLRRVVLNALTWASIRGTVEQHQHYRWDAGFLVVKGFVWPFGVDALSDGTVGWPMSVYAHQNFRSSGEPHCALHDVSKCPAWAHPTDSSEALYYRQVRCDVRSTRPGYDVDLDVLCGLFPGASGGALVTHHGDRLLLTGILVSGDAWGGVNGVTVGSLAEVADLAFAAAGP